MPNFVELGLRDAVAVFFGFFLPMVLMFWVLIGNKRLLWMWRTRNDELWTRKDLGANETVEEEKR